MSDATHVIVTIVRGGASRQLVVHGQTVRIGANDANHIHAPFSWVKDQHLVVKNDAGMIRVKIKDPGAIAYVGNQQVTKEGLMLPPGGSVLIPSPEGLPLAFEFEFKGEDKGLVLIEEEDVAPPLPATTEVAAISPIDEEQGIFQPLISSSNSGHGGEVVREKGNPFLLVGSCLLLMLLLLIGTLVWNQMRRSGQSDKFKSDFALLTESVPKIQELVKQQHFVEAKSLLDQSRSIASSRHEFADFAQILDNIAEKPEIKFGGIGYVQMEGQWLAPDLARQWKAARDTDDPKIERLRKTAQDALAADKDLENGRRASEEALALMAAEPVHPHPLQDELTDLRDQIKNRQIAGEMTAKGYVLYDKKWVTPQEAFRLSQLAKGLVEYKGKWLSKEDAYAAEQTDKGLVLYNGKWMTPDEQQVAMGFIKFEGKWVKPEEKARILQERAQAEEAERQRQEQARIAAAQAAERARREDEAIKARYPDAYTMSQEFVKEILKSPSTAQFQSYESPKVHVSYRDGWYMVMAVVDAQNGFGAMLRSTYLCKLKPIAGDKWQAERTFLLDN